MELECSDPLPTLPRQYNVTFEPARVKAEEKRQVIHYSHYYFVHYTIQHIDTSLNNRVQHYSVNMTVIGRNTGVPPCHKQSCNSLCRSGRLTNLWLVFTSATSHLLPMMKNPIPQSSNTHRSLAILFVAALALSACAGAGTTNDGKTELDLRDFDRQLQDTIGGA